MASDWRTNVWYYGAGYRGVIKLSPALILPDGTIPDELVGLAEVKVPGLHFWQALFLNSEPYAPLEWYQGTIDPAFPHFPFGGTVEPDHPV